MKLALVYTATSEALSQQLLDEIHTRIPQAEIWEYSDPSVMEEARACGHLTSSGIKRMCHLYMRAVDEGADGILNVCSSTGDLAEHLAPVFLLAGVPFIRIDEKMAKLVTSAYSRIGLLATVDTTVGPSMRLLEKKAMQNGRKISIQSRVVNGLFCSTGNAMSAKLLEAVADWRGKIDALVLAQASMAPAEKELREALEIPVFASLRFGVEELCDVVGGKS